MESALYGIYALVVFVSEILLVRSAHSLDFWYVNNSCVNTVRQHFPWSILYISVFRDNTDCLCFEVKARMKRTCSWRRQLKGTKPVEAKDRVNDYETCESEE